MTSFPLPAVTLLIRTATQTRDFWRIFTDVDGLKPAEMLGYRTLPRL
jgi:hypothetical protein